MNRVCEILNIEYPVIQGPMAWITSSELVAAVSNAGGLGVLGTSADSTEIVRGIPESVAEMRKAIHNTKALTDKPFGINVFPEAGDPYGFSKAMIELAKEESVMILVVAGNVSPDEIRQWKEDGFTVIMREANPSVRGAIEAEKAGADIIVATGCDEGGCMPSLSTGSKKTTSDLLSVVVLLLSAFVSFVWSVDFSAEVVLSVVLLFAEQPAKAKMIDKTISIEITLFKTIPRYAFSYAGRQTANCSSCSFVR